MKQRNSPAIPAALRVPVQRSRSPETPAVFRRISSQGFAQVPWNGTLSWLQPPRLGKSSVPAALPSSRDGLYVQFACTTGVIGKPNNT